MFRLKLLSFSETVLLDFIVKPYSEKGYKDQRIAEFLTDVRDIPNSTPQPCNLKMLTIYIVKFLLDGFYAIPGKDHF